VLVIMAKHHPASRSKTPSGSQQKPPSRRLRRGAEIRERLFRSALELFARKGFADTTVEDITEAADVGKGTFFNYFPSKEHILLAFGEMQLAKLESAITEARDSQISIEQFLRALPEHMTQEPARHPGVIRTILQAYLSTSAVRESMMDMQRRVHALHTQIIQMGQERGEIRTDIPAAEMAGVFRQTVFGTLLLWSLYGDASLTERMRTAMGVLWSGLAPRNPMGRASVVPLFTCGD
jgi:AcrR family transcriptional regulator